MEKDHYSMLTAILETKLEGESWKPEYWDPKYIHALAKLNQSKFPVEPLGKLDENNNEVGHLEFITYGQVGARHLKTKGIRYLTTKNFDDLNIDWSLAEKFIQKGGYNDPERSRPQEGDVLLVGNGVGCIKRSAVFEDFEGCNIEQNIVLMRFRDFSHYYVDIFLKSRYGQIQMDRFLTGVGTAYLNFPNIRKILIPILDQKNAKRVEEKWKNFFRLYKRGLNTGNMDEAEKSLNHLIDQVEELIDGKIKTIE